jgi:hypothetical protein
MDRMAESLAGKARGQGRACGTPQPGWALSTGCWRAICIAGWQQQQSAINIPAATQPGEIGMAAVKAQGRPTEIQIHVAPEGNDSWTGRRQEANKSGTDGPLATLKGAQRRVRELTRQRGDTPIRVLVRGGTYFLSSPLVFGPADGGQESARYPRAITSPPVQVTYAACPGERPVVSGGRRVSGWKETLVNGHRAWVAFLPAVRRGTWSFQQLWVNGQRRLRPRLPREGLYRIQRLVGVNKKTAYNEGQDRFVYTSGDLDPDWRNLTDVEVVGLSYWTESRMWVKEIDRRKRLVCFDRVSSKRLSDDKDARLPTQYYVENVFEALQPGEWYLDRGEGRLYYLPLAHEDEESAEVIAPRLSELVRVEGGRQAVTQLHFSGLTFSHSQWDLPANLSNVGQASHQIPGAVIVRNAQSCSFSACSFVHLGGYGVELLEQCLDVEVLRSRLEDLGAGGIKIWHGARRCTLSDCEIGDGGILYPSAVGVLIGQSSGNRILHNHIHHFFYTGISVGWRWGYEESDGYGNIIEHNHVHDIGQAMLSDMGGIYMLGPSPGTRVRHNVFHDISARGYGGWAIYTDEGSSDILIENNLSYRTNRPAFHQHYGRDNIVRNNIWAFGHGGQLALTSLEQHRSFVFEGNIVYWDEGELLDGRLQQATRQHVVFERNLYWRTDGEPVRFGERTWEQWQAQGQDAAGAIADPMFRDPGAGDFGLKRNSPAQKLGFVPFDVSQVGPRLVVAD